MVYKIPYLLRLHTDKILFLPDLHRIDYLICSDKETNRSARIQVNRSKVSECLIIDIKKEKVNILFH